MKFNEDYFILSKAMITLFFENFNLKLKRNKKIIVLSEF